MERAVGNIPQNRWSHWRAYSQTGKEKEFLSHWLFICRQEHVAWRHWYSFDTILFERWRSKAFCQGLRHGDSRWMPSCFLCQFRASASTSNGHICVWFDSNSYQKGWPSAYYLHAMWKDKVHIWCKVPNGKPGIQTSVGSKVYFVPNHHTRQQ